MGYPAGPLLQALAARVLANLEFIDANAPNPKGADQDRPPFSDTQLLISLLGVLVFPHERAPDALGRLLKGYEPLADAITVHHPAHAKSVEVAGPEGHRQKIDPKAIKDLPRVLRNSIAHFNVLPLGRDGRFSGVRVWNKDDHDNITLVADLDFDALRHLARHILSTLAKPNRELPVDDPQDPLEMLKTQRRNEGSKKPPRVTDTIWARLLKACDGDVGQAKNVMDKALRNAADLLQYR